MSLIRELQKQAILNISPNCWQNGMFLKSHFSWSHSEQERRVAWGNVYYSFQASDIGLSSVWVSGFEKWGRNCSQYIPLETYVPTSWTVKKWFLYVDLGEYFHAISDH